jgi:cell division protein FtsI (penicillin-binding protein 3)
MQKPIDYSWRFYSVLILLMIFVLVLLWRLVDLGIVKHQFLLQQSDARVMRDVSIPAYRGMIVDRQGTPLAISTPVDSAWVNPQMFQVTWAQLTNLSKLLGMPIKDIREHLKQNSAREFVYLKRGLPPDVATQIKQLNIPGIFFQREYRRYYPEGEVAAQIVGYTNIDDVGQAGIELAYDHWLRGVPGKERVIKDRLGNTIAVVNVLSEPSQGQDLVLSIDERIQYLAYRYLQQAMQQSNAASGSVVVLNPKTGEILAMANVPSFNPNRRPLTADGAQRNRAVTDVFEPGSTVKPFSMVNALASGRYTPNDKIDTNPGWIIINGHKITDDVPDNGVLTLTQVLQKSSNIGIAKISLSLPPQKLYDIFHQVGFGQVTQSGFLGEVPGVLVDRKRWSQIATATMSFGYGVSVTALQLAHAYAMLANQGMSVPVTFLKQNQAPQTQQIIPINIAQQVLQMLETVIETGGTATQAAIPGYRVAGKTGTSYLAIPGGYDKKHYNDTFVGVVPVSNPQLIAVVTLHGVSGGMHFGGQTAAPAFAKIASAALRILNIPPDDLTK